MATQIEWKKGLFSDNYSLFALGEKIGELNFHSLTGKCSGELRGIQYNFKTDGLIKQNAYISKGREENSLAHIKLDSLMRKAEIDYTEKKYIWQAVSALSDTVQITFNDNIVLKTSGSYTAGIIELNVDEDGILIFACLFLTNYY